MGEDIKKVKLKIEICRGENSVMDNFVCKVATREELVRRWEYLIEIHPGNNLWINFKNNAIKNFDNGSTISYVGLLRDKIICEITAYIETSAFIGDISELIRFVK